MRKGLLCLAATLGIAAPVFAENERIDSSTVTAHKFFEKKVPSLHMPESSTVEQALKLLPSVDIRERGGKSIQTDLGIRGGSPDQTALLLNGVDFTDIRTGHQTHSIPLDSEIIGSIELLEGSSHGLSGALNMTTIANQGNFTRAQLSYGSFGYRYVNISGASEKRWDKRSLNMFGAVSYRGSEGYVQSTDFDNHNVYLRGRYTDSSIGAIEFQAGAQAREFGANGFYSLKFPDQFEATSTIISSLKWSREIGRANAEAWASYRYNTDRFELIRGSEDKVPFNYHKTNTYGAGFGVSMPWQAGRTAIGGEFHRGDILSTVLGLALDNPVVIYGVEGRQYTKGQVRNRGNLQLTHSYSWERLSAKAGLEGDFSPYGFTPLFNAGIDYRLNDNLSLDWIAARSMRLPTFNDLYYTATGYVSNPNLEPEKAIMTKAGAIWQHKGLKISGDAFFRHGNNLIDWVKPTATDNWQSMQITSMNTFGADFDASWKREKGIFRGLTLMAGYINSNKSSEGMISKYAMDYMRFKASLIVDFKLWDAFEFSANASAYDRVGNYTDASANVVSYKPYALINATASYTWRFMKFHLDADNLSNTKYFDYGGLIMPGIWLTAGLIVKLNY